MKCNSKFMRLASIATVALVAMTSCSDDDKNYPADVYLTGTFEPVQVGSRCIRHKRARLNRFGGIQYHI